MNQEVVPSKIKDEIWYLLEDGKCVAFGSKGNMELLRRINSQKKLDDFKAGPSAVK